MKASELIFKRVDNPPAGLNCNFCGNRYTMSVWRIADIPIHNVQNTASIVVCSKACMRKMQSLPEADQYVQDFVARCEGLTPPPVTDEEQKRAEDILIDAAQAIGLSIKRIS